MDLGIIVFRTPRVLRANLCEGPRFCDSALSLKLKATKLQEVFRIFWGNGGSFEITDVQKCVRGRRFCVQL